MESDTGIYQWKPEEVQETDGMIHQLNKSTVIHGVDKEEVAANVESLV